MVAIRLFSVCEAGESPAKPDWVDQRRHRERIEQAIQKNLADMVARDHVMVSRGQQRFHITLEELSESRIRYDPNQGSMDTGVPSVPSTEGGDGSRQDRAEAAGGAGNEDGEGGATEIPVLLEDVSQVLFDKLVLPDLDPDKLAPGAQGQLDASSFGRFGATWCRRRTLIANLTRNAVEGDPRVGVLKPEDLRYYKSAEASRQRGGAVVMALMDTSGSMGNFEKYLAKSFFFWTTEFLRRHYPEVQVVFVSHDVRAREVDEHAFFHQGASGGTVSSSAYRLAYQILQDRYPQDEYNAYAFHFSDGGNLTSDNPLAMETGLRLNDRVNLFGYGEIHDTERSPSQLFQAFHRESRRAVLLRSKADVLQALVEFFGDVDYRKDMEPSQRL